MAMTIIDQLVPLRVIQRSGTDIDRLPQAAWRVLPATEAWQEVVEVGLRDVNF